MITHDQLDVKAAVTPPSDDRKRVEQSYLRYAGVGIEFAVTVVALTVLGVWLDGKFHMAPVLTIVLLFVGLGSATYNLIRSVLGPGRPDKKA